MTALAIGFAVVIGLYLIMQFGLVLAWIILAIGFAAAVSGIVALTTWATGKRA